MSTAPPDEAGAEAPARRRRKRRRELLDQPAGPRHIRRRVVGEVLAGDQIHVVRRAIPARQQRIAVARHRVRLHRGGDEHHLRGPRRSFLDVEVVVPLRALSGVRDQVAPVFVERGIERRVLVHGDGQVRPQRGPERGSIGDVDQLEAPCGVQRPPGRDREVAGPQQPAELNKARPKHRSGHDACCSTNLATANPPLIEVPLSHRDGRGGRG